MSKSLFRRAARPAAIALVAATVTATTVLFGGAAGAATDPGNGSGSETIKSTLADLAAKAGKNRKAKGAEALASDSLTFGDITGDGRPDLGAVDGTGTLWIYPGTGYVYPGTGTRSKAVFGARFSVGRGWSQFTTIVKHGDFNADGKTDVLARNTAGALFFYEGTGTAPSVFRPGVQVGRSWQTFKSIVGVGDFNSDGLDDLIAHKTNGELLLYRGTGNGANPLAGSPAVIGRSFTGGLLTSLGDITGDGRTELFYRDSAGELFLYPSRDGDSPIDAGNRADVGDYSAVRQLVGAGNVYSDAGYEPMPDLLIQVNNTVIVSAPDSGEGSDADFSIGNGWNALYIF
ncbi:VCBS repeat-containing protein [Actinoplanes sp. NBRC 103695]|uniref:FG-GAP repeat domain-containing protein n=1 Tax=Actinoplanes sp. NBRC 103695 TaxID=3032202 RepID=UPI0024A36ABD|nr:VCBS repeat-containing protein [Actinoplanes sp. NBRC 103695]GLY93911.1 hypothetical protein Acsp02_11670 [Actinoplanes sp. NBRC 103695]